MNADLDALHPYPFEKLAALKATLTPPTELALIPLTIGEPQHAPFETLYKKPLGKAYLGKNTVKL